MREGINKCEEVIKELEINSTTTQVEINQFFNKIRVKLDEKEQELMNQLNEMERLKKKELELQKEELKFGIESIIGSCQMVEHSLSLSNSNDDSRLLSMKKLYFSRLDHLSNNIWRIEPCHNPLTEFVVGDETSIYSNISNIGFIDSNEISAEKCLISRNKKQKVFEDEEFKFEIISYSKEGKERKKGEENGNKFKIQIEGESVDDDNQWEIKDLNNGRYEVKIKMNHEGRYFIFVQYNGIDIPSSPLQVQVFPNLKQRNYSEINEPKLTFGSKGDRNGQFIFPNGITTNLTGNILVCDYSNNRIQIFNSGGRFLSTFGSNGNGNGQFCSPRGITINSKGNIIVSDSGNHRIQIFDSERNFISTFGSNGNGNGQFKYLRGICVDLKDNIYVCDCNNNRIQIFDSEGNFISTFGSKGDGNGQFNGPWGITINSKGNIIVSDSGNNRIQIFDSEGNFISKFGNGQFKLLKAICVDLYDNILVCDDNNNRIQLFDSNGKVLRLFKLSSPTDITIDPKTQNIIVCGENHKISIL